MRIIVKVGDKGFLLQEKINIGLAVNVFDGAMQVKKKRDPSYNGWTIQDRNSEIEIVAVPDGVIEKEEIE
jgi:hypothetical protein